MQDEADACADDPFFGHELWSLQEDGDIRMSLDAHLPVHNTLV